MAHRIAIVDDHTLIANALKGIISKFNNFEVSHVCENGLDLKQQLAKGKLPDIILLDISMPEMDGFETARWLKEAHPHILIMVLSMQDDEQSLIKMIKNGAKGYMLKNARPNDLQLGLQRLIGSGHFFPEWASKKIVTSISENTINARPTVELSDREVEFLGYVTTEMTYREIAEKMHCSPRTIENYRDSLFEKLSLKSRIGLAVYALKNGYSK